MAQDIDLIKSLTEMKEDDFTKNILKPLFEAMGYERVDFNGGPFERLCPNYVLHGAPQRLMQAT
ncbi:hypothetical protein ACETWN_20010 [Aeromonas hydrophila]|uniref:hypothetical protein n=1 Tax=Aeromonas hydrophila TaxID=644 RepID=UPI0035A3CD23